MLLNATTALRYFPTHGSLVAMNREYLYNTLEENLRFTISLALQKDNSYTLFRAEDWFAWLTFTVVFIFLIVVDNCIVNRKVTAMSLTRAMVYTMFWVSCAGAFCGWVYCMYGWNKAFMWMSGYMLEWMLSFDNLFVFHMIFSVYGTPDHLKHRPLYLGIFGAVFFRLIFIFIGEYLMHAMFFMHLLFGGFLVYTGAKTALVDDDDDEDPSKQPFVQWLQRAVPFVPAYDSQGAFFVRVPVDDVGKPLLPEVVDKAPEENGEGDKMGYGAVDFQAAAVKVEQASSRRSKNELRVTMLVLVVFCLEVSDLLFAVDSVSAIVAQVNDLFLAYTSAVFAMLGLRATYFIIDSLIQLFSLLKYGVASVLMFIGVKLMISKFYHIPPSVVCVVLFTCVFGSMLASLAKDAWSNRAVVGKTPMDLFGRSPEADNMHEKNGLCAHEPKREPQVSMRAPELAGEPEEAIESQA